MESFEKTLLAGLEPDQYDIVWIEHRDKDRLELNFHVVNMELSTGKALTPYVHSRDIKRIDTWKCIVNDTFGVSDPNDPSKRRTFTFGDNSLPRRDLMKQVDNYLFGLAGEGELNSQSDVINALNAIEGVTVTRNTKTSISFKAEGHEKPLRLKGDMYGKSYRGIENLAAEQARRLQAFNAERDQRLKENKRELRERNQHIADQRREQYPKPTPSKPDLANDVGSPAVTQRYDVGALLSNAPRDKAVSEVPANRKVKREPEGVLLPNQINQNLNHANNNTDKPEKPSKLVHQLIERIKHAITRLAERAGERKAEARELREEYDATERNCVELDRLLKGGKWGPSITRQQAFNQGGRPTQPTPKPKPQSPPQTKRGPTKLRM
ncbi:relaxase/mobilization nuclease domain-containing protein, partial [Vibrio parahaemolyticus]